MGIFAEWQPRYAEVAVPSFPVLGKTPAINGYLKVGLKGSHALATKFTEADAFGIPLARAGITVLDVDTPDERVLADAMSKHGPSPFIVRSGSGNWQAWYRNGGEGRRIRPDPSVPVDILGAGYVVAPPSKAAKGACQIIQGSLDDLPDLPPIASQGCAKSRTYTVHPSPLGAITPQPGEEIRPGSIVPPAGAIDRDAAVAPLQGAANGVPGKPHRLRNLREPPTMLRGA